MAKKKNPAKTIKSPATKSLANKSIGKKAKALKSPAKKVETKASKVVSKVAKAVKKAAKEIVKKTGKPAKPVKATPLQKALPPKLLKKTLEKATADKAADKTKDLKKTAKPDEITRKLKKSEVASDAPVETELLADEAALVDEGEKADAGPQYCRVRECDQYGVVLGYCRYHYLLHWKRIQARKKILAEGKLESYIEELTARYTEKHLEMLKRDLKSEKDFMAAIQELEIDDSGLDTEYEDEAQSFIEEVRGVSSDAPASRDEEDY